MSNVTPPEGSDGNLIEGFSKYTREVLNDDDVEERTDLTASRVLKDHDGVVQKEETSSRYNVENEEKKALTKLEEEKKRHYTNARRKQAISRKQASPVDEEQLKKLDEQWLC